MKVILFKSTPEDVTLPDKFRTSLLSSDFNVPITPQIIPVITFNFVNLDKLSQKLESHEKYEGIILSSPRCVSSVEKAISICSEESDNLLQLWGMHKHIFCVGQATAECAAKLFANMANNIITSQNENAESLGRQIVQFFISSQKMVNNKMLLYPCGNLKTDTIQNIIDSENIVSDIIIVYETVENPQLQYLTSNLSVEQNSPFVFFSPSGLNYALPYIKEMIKDRPLIGIGHTTRDALCRIDGVKGSNIFMCDTPSPAGLVKCLNDLITSKSLK